MASVDRPLIFRYKRINRRNGDEEVFEWMAYGTTNREAAVTMFLEALTNANKQGDGYKYESLEGVSLTAVEPEAAVWSPFSE